MKVTNVFKKTLNHFIDDDVRIIFNYGGSSSSKTISILQLLLLYGLKNENKTITICSHTLPKIKIGPLRDFQKVVLSQDKLNLLNTKKYFNKSELKYTLPNGSTIQFISAESPEKLTGPRHDVVYFDELNHIKKSIYEQVCIRTSHKILASWNPSSLFYANDEFDREDVATIHSTYKDNPYVEESIIKELKQKGLKNKNFKRVYLEGLPGVLEGLIFEEDINYSIVDTPPEKKVKKIIYGLDYGFVDPTALVEITLYEDKTCYVKEYLYKSELTPDSLLKMVHGLNLKQHSKIIAESARPELTEYLHKNGLNIHKVKKTEIIDGINKMYDYFMYVDSGSKNLINELRNYAWAKDKNDVQLEKPIDDYNHCFRGDTLISTDRGLVRIDTMNIDDKVLTRNGYESINYVGKTATKKIKRYIISMDANRYVELYVTDDHLIKTKENLWKRIQDVKEGDVIFLNKSLMGKSTKNTQEKNISVEVVKDYIELYGNFIMEKYQINTTYTIKMVIPKITTSKIWSVLKGKNIYQNTPKKELKKIQNGLRNFTMLELKQQKNGINQSKELNGIKKRLKNKIGETQIYQKESVNVVENYINQNHITQNSARLNVKQNIEEIQELITSPEFANNVEKHLQSINMINENSVVELAHMKIKNIRVEDVGVEDVYDITVDGLPEYFANGVLVHNCIDSIRYAQTMFKKGGSLKIY